MKDVSIFKKVLMSNIKIVMIPIIIIMFLVGYIICGSVKNGIVNEAKNVVYNYGESIDAEIEKVVSVCENTARYPLIFNGLNSKFEDYYSAFMFLDEAKIFLDNLTYELGNSNITICFKNDTLFEGKYFSSHTSIKEYDKIYNEFTSLNTNVIWDEEIFIDEYGKKYFIFYEHMPLNSGCFIKGQVYLPPTPERVSVVTADENLGHTDISTNINPYFDIVGNIDYSLIYIRYFQIYTFLLLLTILIVVVLFYTTQKTTNRVTRDINEFIGHLDAKNIVNGDIDLEVKSGETTELSIIKGTISQLLEQISEITTQNHKTELEKKTLEFELLQSQIDPHTMYNSLSAIRLGAFKRHDDEMVDFVDTMTSYYRKVLNKGKNICSLSEELDLVSKYVKINELSHYKKYNLQIEAPDELMQANILHLILQPFAENAIKHGLGGSKSDCFIKVRCFDDNGIMNIIISDNGRGIDQETLNKLNNLENTEVGYGVRNAFMRLKLYYGNNSSVTFRSERNKGTEVTLKYPI